MPRLVLTKMMVILCLIGTVQSVSGRNKTRRNSIEEKKVSYRVHVSIKNLNIRKGPGTNYDKTGKYREWSIYNCGGV